MFVILGASGKVGAATITALRAQGRPVRAVLREPAQAEPFAQAGCEIAFADIGDPSALSEAMRGACAVQAILPTTPTADDAPGAMRAMIASLAAALGMAAPPLILAISDYGAQHAEGTGMAQIYHEFEAALFRLSARLIVLRSAEHMENIQRLLPVAARAQILPAFHHPLSKSFPTVSARDVGAIAAERLLDAEQDRTSRMIIHVEGPQRYNMLDLATIIGASIGAPVSASRLARAQWSGALRAGGMSESYAELICAFFDAHNAGRIEIEPAIGPVLLGRTEFSDLLRSWPML